MADAKPKAERTAQTSHEGSTSCGKTDRSPVKNNHESTNGNRAHDTESFTKSSITRATSVKIPNIGKGIDSLPPIT